MNIGDWVAVVPTPLQKVKWSLLQIWKFLNEYLLKSQKRSVCAPTFSHLIQNHINQCVCPGPPCSITERESQRDRNWDHWLFNYKTFMFMKGLVFYLPAVNYNGTGSSSVAFIYFSVKKKHTVTNMLGSCWWSYEWIFNTFTYTA